MIEGTLRVMGELPFLIHAARRAAAIAFVF
jgi:hypothetical protein